MKGVGLAAKPHRVSIGGLDGAAQPSWKSINEASSCPCITDSLIGLCRSPGAGERRQGKGRQAARRALCAGKTRAAPFRLRPPWTLSGAESYRLGGACTLLGTCSKQLLEDGAHCEDESYSRTLAVMTQARRATRCRTLCGECQSSKPVIPHWLTCPLHSTVSSGALQGQHTPGHRRLYGQWAGRGRNEIIYF